MLSHLIIGDRLEIYRVSGEGSNRQYAFIGGINLLSDKDDRPFAQSFNDEEMDQFTEIRNTAMREYRTKLKVDVKDTLMALTALVQSVQSEVTYVTEEQEALLTLAWQKLRYSIKVANEHGSAAKKE